MVKEGYEKNCMDDWGLQLPQFMRGNDLANMCMSCIFSSYWFLGMNSITSLQLCKDVILIVNFDDQNVYVYIYEQNLAFVNKLIYMKIENLTITQH